MSHSNVGKEKFLPKPRAKDLNDVLVRCKNGRHENKKKRRENKEAVLRALQEEECLQ